MSGLEQIKWNGELLACILRSEVLPEETTFLTTSEQNMQMGFIVYPENGIIRRHLHGQRERHITGTPEALFIKKGRCEIDIYSEAREFVATRELRIGDFVLLLKGGHGFRMLEDTVFLEIKQGPYLGEDDKEHF